MENASKALLIAGAILICIVLISLGMLIVNSSSEVTDQVGDITTTQAVSTFNSNFTNYSGTQKGSAIKTLLQSLASSNGAQAGAGEHIIEVTFSEGGLNGAEDADSILAAMSKVVSSSKYTVTFGSDDSEGYVTSCEIEKSS